MHRTENQPTVRGVSRRLIAIVVMGVLLTGLLTLTVFAQNNYVITDGDLVTVHKSYSSDPDVVLDEVGIELSEEDTYTTTYNDGVSRIDIQRMQMVTVVYHGERSVIGTRGESVSSLLERSDIVLRAGDELSCGLDTLTFDGMVVEIVNKKIEIVEHDEVIPYETNYFEDPELEVGTEIVLIDGVDGVVHTKTQIVYENGVEISRQIVDETVTTEMVKRLVVRSVDRVLQEQPDEPEHVVSANTAAGDGTASRPKTEQIGENTITTSTGTTYTYTDKLSVLATAYSCEGYTGYTFSGTVARVGAIAVDPKVIPLGTKMYVVSDDGEYVYGYCTAEDTGGLIKGNRIDLYFSTIDECWGFGARTCTVYILG